MSCYRTRRIKNPIDRKKDGYLDKVTISIPDCRCSKCRKQRQNDWLVRSYYEFTSKPQTAFFVTLDFDDAHLPHYNDIPCFDSKLMTNFFETLRSNPNIPKFRYLYASDYGGFLNRPHYHCVFLFPHNSISLNDFSYFIQYYWKFGSHENIQSMNPCYSNPFKAFEYVCKYTTKSLSYEIATREQTMPYRYRSLTQASVGWGAQALDPTAFNSKRLIKEGVVFLDNPVITKKYMLENSVVYLNINDNGMMVPFKIPRYYEMKLMYDSHWDSFQKKQIVTRNTDGYALQEIRHNANYINLFEDFRNSATRYDFTRSPEVISWLYSYMPDSPYNGMQWCDIVEDVMYQETAFYEVCKIYNFLKFRPLKDNKYLSVPVEYRPHWSSGRIYFLSSYGKYEGQMRLLPYRHYYLFVYALTAFEFLKKYDSLRAAHYDDWKQRESEKAAMREKLKRKPFLAKYVSRRGFDFRRLNKSVYKPLKFYELV